MNQRIAEEVRKTVSADIVYTADRFWVRDEAGDDVQVRLEPDGQIYLGYTCNNRTSIKSCTLTWGEFINRFRPLVAKPCRKCPDCGSDEFEAVTTEHDRCVGCDNVYPAE